MKSLRPERPSPRPAGTAPRPTRRIVLLALLAPLATRAAAPAPAFGLDALARLLATRRSAQSRFNEERTVSGLDGPLQSSGTLSFRAPDHFARHTLQPRPESMVVDGNTVSIRRGGRTRQMSLDAVPELTAMIEAVRGTLTGNAATLERHFHVDVAGSAAQWTLTLVPRDERLAAQVREVQIVGQHDELRTIELNLAGGDRSLMTIEPIAPPTVPGR